MKASKIVHNNEDRIKIDFPFNQEIASKIRQITDAKWSKTLGAWHIPHNEGAYNQLIRLFPDIEIPKSPTQEKVRLKTETPQPQIVEKVLLLKSNFTKDEIAIEVSTKSIILKMPKNETDIQFVRTFKYVRWDNAHFRWVIPNYGKNLELIKKYFIKLLPIYLK